MDVGALYAIVVKLGIATLNSIQLGSFRQKKVIHEDGTKTYFEKPFFIETAFMVSMSLGMIFYFLLVHKKIGSPKITLEHFKLVMVPSILTVASIAATTYAMKLGAMPSMTVMFKGAGVVFSGLFSMVLLNRKLYPVQWLSFAIILGGLAFVTIAETFAPKHGKEKKQKPDYYIGIAAVVCIISEAIRSLRVIVEEKLIKHMKFDPVYIVGVEGLDGLIISIPLLIVLNWIPVTNEHLMDYGGVVENTEDTFYVFGKTNLIWGMTLIFVITGVFERIAGTYVTKLLSGVHNIFVSMARGFTVWVVEIIIFYSYTDDEGHHWFHGVSPWSAMKLVGYAIIVFGMLNYDGVVKIPGFIYPAPRPKHGHGHSAPVKSVEDPMSTKMSQETPTGIVSSVAPASNKM